MTFWQLVAADVVGAVLIGIGAFVGEWAWEWVKWKRSERGKLKGD